MGGSSDAVRHKYRRRTDEKRTGVRGSPSREQGGREVMEQQVLFFVSGLVALLLVLAGVAVALEYKRTMRQREFEHVERMKAIECGYPLPDESSTRHKLLGAIGVIVPAASLAAAAWSTQLILGREDY